MHILKWLFDINTKINVLKQYAGKPMFDISASSDDEERYLKMIMQIDPNEPGIFERNTNNISYNLYGINDSLSSPNVPLYR